MIYIWFGIEFLAATFIVVACLTNAIVALVTESYELSFMFAMAAFASWKLVLVTNDDLDAYLQSNV